MQVPVRTLGALVRGAPRHWAQRLFVDRHAELWLGSLGVTASRTEIRAGVIDVVRETSDVRTFVLRPNARWPGHRAGQWTSVELEVDGARARRCYSISSAPSDPLVSITVKRVPGGRVSGWLHDRVRTGDVLRLGAPSGDFVLPDPMPPRMLLLSGGSGITPMMSMLRAIAAQPATATDVVLVHHARHRDDVVFRAAIDALVARDARLRRVWCLDDEGPPGLDEARLAALVPDLAERETFLCGPSGMMERAEAMWVGARIEHRLHVERFTPARIAEPSDPAEVRPVWLHYAGRRIAARTEGTLLDQLERAGERPPSGCRMGICRSCTCLKRSGTVRDLRTGALSSAPDEVIQLCVSVPSTDVELGL